MNKLIIIIAFCFGSLIVNATTPPIPFVQIPIKQRAYKFVVPYPFGETMVKFHIDKSRVNELINLEINTLGNELNVPKKLYKNLALPRVRNIEFIYQKNKMGSDMHLDEFEFYIFYGTAIKVECGYNKYENLNKSKIFTVKSDHTIVVAEDNSQFESCKEYTKKRYELFESDGGKQ